MPSSWAFTGPDWEGQLKPQQCLLVDEDKCRLLPCYMTLEIPLQSDMFTGALVDNRSSYQKRLDQERQAPQQMILFAPTEMAQLGESVRPWLSRRPDRRWCWCGKTPEHRKRSNATYSGKRRR